MAIKHIELVVGRAVILEGQKLLISHYAVDGEMITLFTDKGEKTYPMSRLDFVLSSIKLISSPPEPKKDIKSVEQAQENQLLQCTTDYSLFGKLKSNRPVIKGHVKKLALAIKNKNLLHLNAILVNKNYEVIDGQHRLEAAKLLNVPVFFIVDDEIGKHDIATLNTNKKNWSLDDYVHFYKNEGIEDFKILNNFLVRYPTLPLSSALVLLSHSGNKDTEGIRQGLVDVSNIVQAKVIADFLIWLNDITSIPATITSVAQAVRDIFNLEGFDEDYFKQKINDQPRSIVKCINRKQYLEMFLEIYNYKLSKNRLSL